MMPPNSTGPSVNRDIGVAIALRRQQQQLPQSPQQQRQHQHNQHAQQQQPRQASASASSSVSVSARSNVKRRRQRRRPWWHDLGIGLSLYLCCIYLPTLWSLLSYFYHSIWCPFANKTLTRQLGADAAWTDVGIILVLSISLAIVRIVLVQYLVDFMQSPHHVEAMVRCKSIHLLSSAYPQSLTPTPDRKKIVNIIGTGGGPSLPSLPLLSNNDLPPVSSLGLLQQIQDQQQQEEDGTLQPRMANSPSQARMKRSPSWVESTWESVVISSQKALIVDENPRLHTAPRYATAVFRCVYGVFSLTTAWLGFQTSNFWPKSVGGSGATRNCWNLKGSPGMAEDFDGLDALLKFYYLLQASYHLHSGAFHVLTMIILWARRPQSKVKAKPFTAYWRSLLQHGIALLLIGGSHLFASTRRLGAIGSFALDASSLLLHALQLCINAPQTIPPIYIKVLHRGLVIPLFVYCRFYVWPFVVWRSAMFESKDWLQQLESTMFPGIAEATMWVFSGLTVVLLGLNLILFRRLVNHPHLQRVYNKNEQRQS